MRAIAPELQARLDGGATRLCRCWRVRRRDGRTYGFTDHDRDLIVDGTLCKASSGMDASAVQSTTGLAVDNAQALGALSDAGLSAEEIRAGRFDGAAVEHWLVDWERPDLFVNVFRGTFGEIRRSDALFEVELRGLAEGLNTAVGRTIQRNCDRRLGDAKCGFDLQTPGYWAEATVSEVISEIAVLAHGLADFPAGWFALGIIEWLNGTNAGEKASVKADTTGPGPGRSITLWERPGAALAPGDRFRIAAGCDKRMTTCRDKFNNILNFRGFPHIPGEDWVTAYPKDGDVHDGSSRRDG